MMIKKIKKYFICQQDGPNCRAFFKLKLILYYNDPNVLNLKAATYLNK